MDEVQEIIRGLSDTDFSAAEAEQNRLRTEQRRLDMEIAALEQNTAAEHKDAEIQAQELQLKQLRYENWKHREEQQRQLPDLEGIRQDLKKAEQALADAKSIQAKEQLFITETKTNIEQCRAQWKEINGETFSGGNCPTCGQALPKEKLAEARRKFEERKEKLLNDTVLRAEKLKWSLNQETARAEKLGAKVKGLEEDRKDLKEALSRAEAQAAGAEIRDMDGYAEKQAELERKLLTLQEEYRQLTSEPEERISALQTEEQFFEPCFFTGQKLLSGQNAQLLGNLLTDHLLTRQQDTAKALERVEKLQYLLEEFSRYKAGFVEESVNGWFRLAKFRLFREQANGGIEDRCDIVYDGVPYGSLNNGMKLNLGIDIVETLAAYYGVLVPLFIDNAESVTKIQDAGTQTIRLVVSEADKELRCEYED